LVEQRGEQRTIRRIKVVHFDPTKEPLAARLEAVTIQDPKSHAIWQEILDRRSVLLREVSDEALERIAQNPEHLEVLRALAPVSIMAVPLVARNRVLGTIGFLSVRPGSIYQEHDLKLAEELAGRAALAIDNSRLYGLSQQAIRARDEVLGVVAHDLRNPINTVAAAAQLLLLQLEDEREGARRIVRAIARASERANRLIQDLLDVARLEAGRLGIDRAPCEPCDLLHEAFETMRLAAEGASIALTTRCDPDLPSIRVDRDRLLQVFTNLVGNAVKFTPAEGHIELRATRLGHDVCFAVADTGSGIPEEHKGHVFDRFWQAASPDRQGAGLGLAIAKGIVEAHRGKIWLDSNLQQGSTFFFTIPTTPQTEISP
jgi:signal transduction histidine kinase